MHDEETDISPIPLYSPAELVRLELLRYEDPQGLHPIELAWRQLARKLFNHVEAMQACLKEHKHETGWGKDKVECTHKDCVALRNHTFPPKFSIKKS